jgi:hypothetical protein
MRQSHMICTVALLISLSLTAGCVAVSADTQTTSADVVLAPHLPLLEWQGYGPWGDGDAATCKQLYVYFGNVMTAGYCGQPTETVTPVGSEFAEMASRLAPFSYSSGSDKLLFRGYGSVASPAWQRAILAWAQWTAGESISGQVCAACRTAMSWLLDEFDERPGVCRHLTVLNYGYATTEEVPCAGGTATHVAGGWLQTAEWERIDAWLSSRAPAYQDDGYLAGSGELAMNEAEIGELDALAHAIYDRLGKEAQLPECTQADPVPVAPAPTPDAYMLETIAAVMAGAQPVNEIFVSPDGQWQIKIAMYGCVATGDGDNYAFEALRLVRGGAEAPSQVDSQLINCGGLGAYGFQGLCWSPDSRYFYYHTGREGVPDGMLDGENGWTPPIRQLDVTSGMIRELDGTAPAIGNVKDSVCTSTQP